MAFLYTEEADRKRLARDAMPKIAGQNETATSIPAPLQEVRAPENENRNEKDGKFGKWCGREDSNLHGLPR